MSRRDNVDARCPTCMLHRPVCICAIAPRLEVRTRLLLLVHYREARKPTNTGQLAARCLGGRVAIIGDRERPLPDPIIGAEERAVLLFPDDDAVPLASIAPAPTMLVVPDGNWRQAAKMGRRVPGLADIPRVTLDVGSPTEYRLRTERREGGLATIEAIARAYRILEGEAVEAALLGVFRELVARTLAIRGTR